MEIASMDAYGYDEDDKSHTVPPTSWTAQRCGLLERCPPAGTPVSTFTTLVYVTVPKGIHPFPKHEEAHPQTATRGPIYGFF